VAEAISGAATVPEERYDPMQLRTPTILSLVVVAGLSVILVMSRPGKSDSNSEFKCGPGFLTYSVKVQAGSTGGGVRCVKFIDYQVIDGQISGAYWYGEGTLNQYIYRHLGNIYLKKDPVTGATTTVSLASDIYGNGENAEFTASDLKLSPIDGQNLIQETSEWPEQWILERSGVANYTSNLKPVTECGKFFTKLTVNDGAGVRCAIRPNLGEEYPDLVWYGDSDSGSRRHLGIVTSLDNEGARATAINFCSKDICPTPADHQLLLKGLNHCAEPFNIRISGSWNELWTSTEKLICAR
jgi:hypothetical protein